MRALLRYAVAAALALGVVFVLFWIGSWLAGVIEQPNRLQTEFTVGVTRDLCGYEIDVRHEIGGYDLDQWQGERCDDLSELDHCILSCLADAGTIEIGAACYRDCLDELR